MKITAIILTLNEEIHLARCIENIQDVVDRIVVVDAYSSDKTVEIARKYNCTILQNGWTNHGHQFNWALAQLGGDTDWVLRIDADEYLDHVLQSAICDFKIRNVISISGAYFKRVIQFQGKQIRFGGMGSIRALRLFRYGQGNSETRWMDEHIVISGNSIELPGIMVDDNLNTLSFWVNKHNRYADKEAFEILTLRYQDSVPKLKTITLEPALYWKSGYKRWIKNHLYQKMPNGLRSFLYFLYRYLFCLGFLDGSKGFAFHFLQGYWYRYLIDLKTKEAEQFMQSEKVSYLVAAKKILKIDVAE
jgi:glycosyltransferase involved in cell wall biosynthesis